MCSKPSTRASSHGSDKNASYRVVLDGKEKASGFPDKRRRDDLSYKTKSTAQRGCATEKTKRYAIQGISR
jgi:hypothetical protein